MQHNTAVVAALGGAVLVMYGFYRVSMRIMHFFFNVSDKQIFELGFIAGVFAAIGIGIAGVFMARRLTFHVDDVYRAALHELRKHEAVGSALGGKWQPGGFRGYAVESMKDALKGSERRERTSYFEAPARRVQMIFMLRGAERDGMVSLEAHKRGGSYHFDMLSLDAKGGAGKKAEHLFLKGESDHALFEEVAEILEATKGGR